MNHPYQKLANAFIAGDKPAFKEQAEIAFKCMDEIRAAREERDATHNELRSLPYEEFIEKAKVANEKCWQIEHTCSEKYGLYDAHLNYCADNSTRTETAREIVDILACDNINHLKLTNAMCRLQLALLEDYESDRNYASTFENILLILCDRFTHSKYYSIDDGSEIAFTPKLEPINWKDFGICPETGRCLDDDERIEHIAEKHEKNRQS